MARFSIIFASGALVLAASGATPLARANDAARVAPAAVREVTIPAGTLLRVRLNSTVSSATSRVEQPVTGTLLAPVRVNGVTVVPAGSRVNGYVSSVHRSGKVKGRGSVAVRFATVTVAGRGEPYPIAAGFSRMAPATKKQDAAKIGVPAAGGAVIGGLIGGKKGAATGAAVGGGAGTAVVLSTRGKEVVYPRGATLSLRLQRPVTLRVRVP